MGNAALGEQYVASDFCGYSGRLASVLEARVRDYEVPDYVAAIDQGTTSTRCMIFDHAGSRGGP